MSKLTYEEIETDLLASEIDEVFLKAEIKDLKEKLSIACRALEFIKSSTNKKIHWLKIVPYAGRKYLEHIEMAHHALMQIQDSTHTERVKEEG